MVSISHEQLRDGISISTKQQSKLRKEDSKPIIFKNIRRLVYYSIYDVANFSLNGEAIPNKEASEEDLPAPQITVKKKPTKLTAPVKDLSHIFMLRSFAKSLEERATAMLSLAENLNNYANKKEMMDNFQKKFPPKDLKTTILKE